MKLTFLGHACFLLDDGTHKVLTDPFLSGNALAAASAEEVEADYIFVTHGHGDHVGDAVEIAHRTGATVCGCVELLDQVFAPAGVKTMEANLGGTLFLPFGSAKLVPAVHSCGIPGGLSCGFVFTMGDRCIYHAGDTSLTADMGLLAENTPDVALLPIGGLYTMDPADAIRAAAMIHPKLVVPMHYNTFPPITQDPDAFAANAKAAGCPAIVLHPGETLQL